MKYLQLFENYKKYNKIAIETSSDNIDIQRTLGNRAEYPDEYEVAIINDKDLKILNIEEVEPV